MKTNVLFIANGSLANPILQTQGLPYLYNLDNSIYQTHILSFEIMNHTAEINARIEAIMNRFGSRINFHPISINSKNLTIFRISAFIKGLKKLNILIKNYDIKILHARNFFSAFLSIIIKIFFKPNIKVLYDNRGLAFEERVFAGQLKNLSEKVFRELERIVVNRSDLIVVVSKKLEEHLLNKYGDANFKKIKIINNKTNIPPLHELEISEKKSSINITGVYSGSAASWQNLNGMMELFKIALSRFDNIIIKVFTWQKKRFIKTLLNYPELNNKIEIQLLEQEKVFDNLIKCNFGIIFRGNNLISNVSSPLKFAEYLAAGLPIIINEGVGEMEDIILKNNIGIIIRGENYYRALNEMLDLLKDKNVYSRCRETAIKNFNIKDAFSVYQKIYERLLNS